MLGNPNLNFQQPARQPAQPRNQQPAKTVPQGAKREPSRITVLGQASQPVQPESTARGGIASRIAVGDRAISGERKRPPAGAAARSSALPSGG